MKKVFKLAILVILIGALAGPGFVFGQSEEMILNKEVEMLNNQIQDQKNKMKKIQDQQEQYSKNIKQKQQERASLDNQLDILDNSVAKAQLDTEIVESEINKVELEIRKTDIEITNKNKEIETEKDHIANVLNLMHQRDKVSSLEIMILNDSLSDFLSQFKYLEDINENIKDSLNEIEKLKRQLEKEKKDLDKQNEDLTKLKDDLKDKLEKLAAEKEQKIYILDQVNQSERQYQDLLANAKREQQKAAAEIADAEQLVRAKLSKLEEQKLQNNNGFAWPVPKNTITAYFHDPDYPFRKIFEHPAVDIRAAQGTKIKAPLSGYVARVQTGGKTGYGYIMLIHGDGLSTVFGHVSKIYVEEDEYVTQGQVVGLSGGLPGTPGAGRLTTGPHLHFEVRSNGIPVDPLEYLP